MKKLFDIVVLMLALNFLVIAGGVGWLYKGGKLSPDRVKAIKAVVFPPETSAPATQPAEKPSTQPSVKLEELLAQYAGKPPAEQLHYIRESFDSQMAQLERGQRELVALQTRIEQERDQVARAKAALDAERKKLEDREKLAEASANDKGFQDSLAVYQSLPAKQVKTIFMGLDEKTTTAFMSAMEPKAAAKIMKEFKSPEEMERLKRIMERMRQPLAGAKE